MSRTWLCGDGRPTAAQSDVFARAIDTIEVGNVILVELFVGRRTGGDGVKLEQQLVASERGPELLTHSPISLA